MIRTWQERCEDFDDSHITTHQDVKNMMMEEIEELRTALQQLTGEYLALSVKHNREWLKGEVK